MRNAFTVAKMPILESKIHLRMLVLLLPGLGPLPLTSGVFVSNYSFVLIELVYIDFLLNPPQQSVTFP